MKRMNSLVLAALLPAVASAQLGAIRAAKEAGQKSDAGNARIQSAATKQVEQGEGQPGGAADDGSGTGRAEGSATAADGGRGAVPPPDTYTIRPGDTLWDLSGRFLNNPWYWPKVWSYNPDITNPHWIEPGNLLRFYPGAEEAPSRVEAVAGVVEPGQPEEPEAAPPRELEDLTKADMNKPMPVETSDEVLVSGPYRIGFVPPKTVMVRRDTFVTPREVAESGSLVAAFEEKMWLSTDDRAYARFKGGAGLTVGETYVVYRTDRPIHHPITHELIGYQTKILGTAKAVKVDPKAVTVIIGQSVEPIERGDLLGPWTEKLYRPVSQRPSHRDVNGRILAAQIDVLNMLGEQHIVFVDKGKADGVEEGNVFRVVRSGDRFGLEPGAIPSDSSLPDEVVGDLLVIDVKDNTCTALVTRSLLELAIGDRVEMRAAANGG
jgi:LysM domain